MAIKPATGTNAIDMVNAVKKKVEELKPFFPPDVKAIYPFDTTPFVRISIKEVVKTLLEAIVFVVLYLFLQNWRATLIPTIAVPIVILGTLGVMAGAGFSINTLTLFGLVLCAAWVPMAFFSGSTGLSSAARIATKTVLILS